MKIILVGYMGSGKSTIGKLLSQKSNLPFLDLDTEISRMENKKISEIFAASGEIHFRKKETEVLRELLVGSNSFVLALGGGTPCYGSNLQMLKENQEVVLIYLKTSLEELRGRLGKEKSSRPLISHLESEEALEDFIRKHLFERAFYYNQSDIVIDTDAKGPAEISDEILRELN